MPKGDKLSQTAVLKLPPMLWGHIRWNKIMGSPVGDPATGFRVFAEEHTATQFRIGRAGPEPIPGTGVWKPAVSVPCWTAPDEGSMHLPLSGFAHTRVTRGNKYMRIARQGRNDHRLGWTRW